MWPKYCGESQNYAAEAGKYEAENETETKKVL